METLVYIVIISLIITVVVSTLLWIVSSEVNAKAPGVTAVNTRNAIRIMTRKIRESKILYTTKMNLTTQHSC